MSEWKTGTAAELRKAIRPSGHLFGHSKVFSTYFDLKKGDILRALSLASEQDTFAWFIKGNPDEGRRYAKDRRTVIIWLGK